MDIRAHSTEAVLAGINQVHRVIRLLAATVATARDMVETTTVATIVIEGIGVRTTATDGKNGQRNNSSSDA